MKEAGRKMDMFQGEGMVEQVDVKDSVGRCEGGEGETGGGENSHMIRRLRARKRLLFWPV